MKIALCFLVYDRIRCEDIWRTWVENAGEHVEVYIHSKYKFVTKMPDFFKKIKFVNPIPTEWGTFSLVEATSLLFSEALKDSNITKFVLLSDSCIPLKPWKYVYEKLIKNDNCYAYVFNNCLERYFNTKMRIREHLRKHSQWVILNRESVEWTRDNIGLIKDWYTGDQWVDESWFLTSMSYRGKPVTLERTTYVDWPEGPLVRHPTTFKNLEFDELKKLVFNSDYLFGRKFTAFTTVDNMPLIDNLTKIFEEFDESCLGTKNVVKYLT